jgi:hypothetical protein
MVTVNKLRHSIAGEEFIERLSSWMSDCGRRAVSDGGDIPRRAIMIDARAISILRGGIRRRTEMPPGGESAGPELVAPPYGSTFHLAR